MLLPFWLAVSIAVLAGLVFAAFLVRSAWRMSVDQAKAQRSTLFVSIAILLLEYVVNHLLGVRDIRIVGAVVDFIGDIAGIGVLVSIFNAVPFLFRRGYRAVGAQMLVAIVITISLTLLAESGEAHL